MLDAHVMVDADISALQSSPERLHAVRVSLPSHGFSYAVLHSLMPARQIMISQHLIGVDGRRVDFCASLDETLQGWRVCGFNHTGIYLMGVSVPHADN